MKEEDPSVTAYTRATMTKRESSEVVLVGKRHYKFWVITAIVLLAVWSMFTGSLTLNLKLSAVRLIRFSHDVDSRILNDVDVLELEEREKVVRRMWDVYTHSTGNRLPRFWSEAFQAAYEHLVSEVRGVRDAAVSEIAKMSLHSFHSEQHPPQSENSRVSRKIKQKAERSVGNIKAGNN